MYLVRQADFWVKMENLRASVFFLTLSQHIFRDKSSALGPPGCRSSYRVRTARKVEPIYSRSPRMVFHGGHKYFDLCLASVCFSSPLERNGSVRYEKH